MTVSLFSVLGGVFPKPSHLYPVKNRTIPAWIVAVLAILVESEGEIDGYAISLAFGRLFDVRGVIEWRSGFQIGSRR